MKHEMWEDWFNKYQPVAFPTKGIPFRMKWSKRPTQWQDAKETKGNKDPAHTAPPVGAFLIPNWDFPKIIEIKEGLKLDIDDLWDNEKQVKGEISGPSIVKLMEDLMEYVKSGRYRSAHYGEEDVLDNELALLRIAQEEGVVEDE